METAEALAKAGVISKQDFENIKREAEKEFEEFNKQLKAEAKQTTADENKDKPEDNNKE